MAPSSNGNPNWPGCQAAPQKASRPGITGAVYGGAYVPGMPTPTLVAVSPKGASWSADEGATSRR